jgi:transposase InsO family protein
MDRTNVLVEPVGGVSRVLVLDGYTTNSVGPSAGPQAKTTSWLSALDQAGQRQFPGGSRDHDLHLMSENGCPPTAIAFLQAAAPLGVTHAFTRDNTPKGNADPERLLRPLKEERRWLREGTSPLALEQALPAWIEWSNTRYSHSARGERTPCQVEHQPLSHSTQVTAC